MPNLHSKVLLHRSKWWCIAALLPFLLMGCEDEATFSIPNLGPQLHGGDSRTWVPEMLVFQVIDPATLTATSSRSDSLNSRLDTLRYGLGQGTQGPATLTRPDIHRYRSNNTLEILDTLGNVLRTRTYELRTPADVWLRSDSVASRVTPYHRVVSVTDTELRVEIIEPVTAETFFFQNLIFRRAN